MIVKNDRIEESDEDVFEAEYSKTLTVKAFKEAVCKRWGDVEDIDQVRVVRKRNMRLP